MWMSWLADKQFIKPLNAEPPQSMEPQVALSATSNLLIFNKIFPTRCHLSIFPKTNSHKIIIVILWRGADLQ